MKVVITGAIGFVGKALVSQCREKKMEVIGIDMADLVQEGYHKADILSNSIFDIIPEEVDAVIHLAALSRDSDCKNKAYDCFKHNVMGTLNVMEAAEKRKAKQLIFASTEWVYDRFELDEIKDEESSIDITNLKSEYAFSKLVSEVNLRQKYQHGFCDVTILRFGIIYGPRPANWSAVEAIFSDVKTKDIVSVGSLRTGRCFIHISDIVTGIIKAIGLTGFNLINLQGDRFITLGDVIKTSQILLKKTVEVAEKIPENFNTRNVSNMKAKALLKWAPQFDLEKGLRSLMDSRFFS